MVHIKIKKGLDIPIKGSPSGPVSSLAKPKEVALDCSPFEDIKFKLLVTVGDTVKIGQGLAHDKQYPQRIFVSPGSGTVKEIVRGIKRRLLYIVITLDEEEVHHPIQKIDVESSSTQELYNHLLENGIFACIRMRPFDLLANPSDTPKNIFVKAIESAPFTPCPSLQIQGFEQEFQMGLNALCKLTPGKVHLVYSHKPNSKAFLSSTNVVHHTAQGPHPIGLSSTHIHYIDPIQSLHDITWTLSALAVLRLGYLLMHQQHYLHAIIGIGGSGVIEDKRQFVKARQGHPIGGFIANRCKKGHQRYISGDPLMGSSVQINDYLGFYHSVVCIIPERTNRELLHFFKPGINKYSSHKAYLSGHFSGRHYIFDTNQHGEARSFADNIYDKVMPMQIPVMHLLKAVIGEDFDTAENLGFLEIASEDFSLSTFICPSKIEMVEIIHNALLNYSKEVLY